MSTPSSSGVKGLTYGQVYSMIVTERLNSCLSIIGILFVIVTYLSHSSFDKPINRLIFFASWGNLGSNIASLISEAGPIAGQGSALCQFQAFLVQMFLGVDCYWAFCMAINVYLVFFRGYTTEQLRALDVRYLLACYGLAFVPALAFLFVYNQEQEKVYGPAIIWCWVTSKWDWMRIVFLYGIVWVAIGFALVIYGMAARQMFRKRNNMDGFMNPLKENPFTNTVTTEIEITHEERMPYKEEELPTYPQQYHPHPHPPPPPQPYLSERKNSYEYDRYESDLYDYHQRHQHEQNYQKRQISNPATDDPYSVQVGVPRLHLGRPLPAALRMRTLTRDAAERENNADAFLYARVAFLFFLALLVTWVPTSANRMWAMANPNAPPNFAFNYVACFLFPLQGFWNMLVYITSSQTACRRLTSDIFSRGASRKGSLTADGMREDRLPFPSTQGKQRIQSLSS